MSNMAGRVSETRNHNNRDNGVPVELSLVIACGNKTTQLEESVAVVIDTLDHAIWTYELIFVDDCPEDDSSQTITRLIAQYPSHGLRAAYHEKGTGRGRALYDGIRIARGHIAGFLDTNLEVDARYIPAMARAIEMGADIASARRVYKLTPRLLFHCAQSRIYHWLSQRILGLNLEDTEAGFKFFNRERILPVMAETHDPTWLWDTEIMARAYHHGYCISEIPCLVTRRAYKTSTVRLVRDTLGQLLRLWRFAHDLNIATTRIPRNNSLGGHL